MKIRKLQLKNIGVFDDETIKFQECPKGKAEIHIFTGQNGSGKTTILMALASIFDNYTVSENPTLGWTDEEARFAYINIKTNNFFNRIKKPWEESLISFDVENLGERRNHCAEPYTRHFEPEFDKEVWSFSTYDKENDTDRKLFNYKFASKYSFAAFAFSGYRQIQSERVEAIYEPKEFNPLSQSLEFVKDYSKENQITINQLIANNISKSAIEKGRNEKKSKKFANVIKSIEQALSEITGWRIEFDLETEPTNLITKVNGEELDFDVLPDGLRSLISWIADLAGRVDLLKWQDDLPIFEKNLILLLDEIEVHLHPAWQRKVLPVVQKLFKNSQIFVSTHSPFVVNSIDDAWVYKLELENGKAKVAEIVESENSNSITQVLREIFGVDYWFGWEVQNKFDEFKKLKNKIISNGADEATEKKFLEKARLLANEPNDQLKQIIKKDIEDLNETRKKRNQEPYAL